MGTGAAWPAPLQPPTHCALAGAGASRMNGLKGRRGAGDATRIRHEGECPMGRARRCGGQPSPGAWSNGLGL